MIIHNQVIQSSSFDLRFLCWNCELLSRLERAYLERVQCYVLVFSTWLRVIFELAIREQMIDPPLEQPSSLQTQPLNYVTKFKGLNMKMAQLFCRQHQRQQRESYKH